MKINWPIVLPTLLIIIDIASGAVYLGHGDWRKTIYWFSAAALTTTVTF